MPYPDITAATNTPPTAITLPSFAGTAVAPAAVNAPAMQPTGAAPAAVAAPAMAPAAVAPQQVAAPAMAPTGVAPAAVAAPVMQPTNAQPVAVAPPAAAPTAVAAVAVPLPSFVPTNAAPQLVDVAPIVPSPTDANMHTAALNLIGNLTLNQVFGMYKAPANCVIKGVQLSAQKAPGVTDAVITLVDADGVSLGRVATLPAGALFADVVFEVPLPLLGGAIVRAKITQVGTAPNPGAYLTANLVVQLV